MPTSSKNSTMRHSSNGVAIDSVAIAILRKADQIVLVQQRAPQSGQLYWVLPGGLVEPGELVVDALIREAREDAGGQQLVGSVPA